MTIRDRIDAHEELRETGLNLVAAENAPSLAVREALASDLAGRYGEDWYGGSQPAVALVEAVEELARDLFAADHAIVTALSGNISDVAVLLSRTEVGDRVAMPPVEAGGYPFGVAKFDRERVDLPMDGPVPDADALPSFVDAYDPDLVLLGASRIPFPHPTEAARDAVDAPLVFDGAHVLGLVATGTFQDPLREGADALIGSTHKSLPGPQGGLVVTDDADLDAELRAYLAYDEEAGIGLVDNAHPNRIAGLGIALEELEKRPGYGEDVQANSRALAEALDERGVPVAHADRGYTDSHQVLLDMTPDEARRACRDLEAHGIFVDKGGRVGTSEVTWRGMGPEEMDEIAELVARVLDGDVDGVDKEVEAIARGFPAIEGV